MTNSITAAKQTIPLFGISGVAVPIVSAELPRSPASNRASDVSGKNAGTMEEFSTLGVRAYVAKRIDDIDAASEGSSLAPAQEGKQLLNRLAALDGKDFAKTLRALSWAEGDLSAIWQKVSAFANGGKGGFTELDIASLTSEIASTLAVKTEVARKVVSGLAESAGKTPGQTAVALFQEVASRSGNERLVKLGTMAGAALEMQGVLSGTAAAGTTIESVLKNLGSSSRDTSFEAAGIIAGTGARVLEGKSSTAEVARAFAKLSGGAVEQITDAVLLMTDELAKGKQADLSVVVGKAASVFGLSESSAKKTYEVLTNLVSKNPNKTVGVAELLGALSELKVLSGANSQLLQQAGQLIVQADQVANSVTSAKTTKDLILSLSDIGGPAIRNFAEQSIKVAEFLMSGKVDGDSIARLVVDAFGGSEKDIPKVNALVSELQKAQASGANPSQFAQKLLEGAAKVLGPDAQKLLAEGTKYISAASSLTQQLGNPRGASAEGIVLTLGQFFGDDGVKISKALVELKGRLDTGTLDEKSASTFLSQTLGWDAKTTEATITSFKNLASGGISSWDAAFEAIKSTGASVGGALEGTAISAANLAQSFTNAVNANGGDVVQGLKKSIPELSKLLAPDSPRASLKAQKALENTFAAFEKIGKSKSAETTVFALASLGGERAESIARGVVKLTQQLSTEGFNAENVARTAIEALGGDVANVANVKKIIAKLAGGIPAGKDAAAFADDILGSTAKLLGPTETAGFEAARKYVVASGALAKELQNSNGSIGGIVRAISGVLGDDEQKAAGSLLEINDLMAKGGLTAEVFARTLGKSLNLPQDAVDSASAAYQALLKNGGTANWEVVSKAVAAGASLVGGQLGQSIGSTLAVIGKFSAANAENNGDTFKSLSATVPELARLLGGGAAETTARLEAGIQGLKAFSTQGIDATWSGGLTSIGTALASGDIVKYGKVAEQGSAAFNALSKGDFLKGGAGLANGVAALTGSKEAALVGQGLQAIQTMGSGVANGFTIGLGSALGVAGGLIGGEVGRVMGQASNLVGMALGGPLGLIMGGLSLLSDLFGWGKPPRMAKISTQNQNYIGAGADGQPANFAITQNGGESGMRIDVKALNAEIVDKPVALRERMPRLGNIVGPSHGASVLLNNEWAYSTNGNFRFGINTKLGLVTQKKENNGQWSTTWRAAVNPPPGSIVEMNQKTGKLEVWALAANVIPGEPPAEGYKRTSFVKIWESNRGSPPPAGQEVVLHVPDGGDLMTAFRNPVDGRTEWKKAEFTAAHDGGTFGIGSYHRDADEGHTVGTTTYVTKGNYGYFDNSNQMAQFLKRGALTDIAFKSDHGEDFVLFNLGNNAFDELTKAEYDKRLVGLTDSAKGKSPAKPTNVSTDANDAQANAQTEAKKAQSKQTEGEFNRVVQLAFGGAGRL